MTTATRESLQNGGLHQMAASGKKLSRVQKLKAAAVKRRIHSAKIAELHLKGWGEKDIAWATDTPAKTVREVIAELKKSWQEKQGQDSGTARERELERLDQLYRAAWAAWERSIGPKRKAIVLYDDDGKVKSKKTEEWEDVGDARFLSELRALSESRRKLLGIDAPTLLADATPMLSRDEMHKKTLEIVNRFKGIGGPVVGGDGGSAGYAVGSVVDAEIVRDVDGDDGPAAATEIQNGNGNGNGHYPHGTNGSNGSGNGSTNGHH